MAADRASAESTPPDRAAEDEAAEEVADVLADWLGAVAELDEPDEDPQPAVTAATSSEVARIGRVRRGMT
ncbi:MAG TPA: hypothetical protein VG365_04340 [Solirubrobacteraceae bacterium]|nr:hypothetical protein [Solirubrobacteraceae bacterium]